jgi:hypothetical protein
LQHCDIVTTRLNKRCKICNDFFGLQLWTTKYWISVEWHIRSGPSCQTTFVLGGRTYHKVERHGRGGVILVSSGITWICCHGMHYQQIFST